MNRIEYLLSCLIEEAAEVQKEATKSQRFGLTSRHPKGGENNITNLVTEFYELEAVFEMLKSELKSQFPHTTGYFQVKVDKIKRVNEYMERSEKNGQQITSADRIDEHYPRKLSEIGPGDLMTVEEFKTNVDSGAFIDYDGYGYPVHEGKINPKIIIKPSMVKSIPDLATHILWFNK